MTDLELVNFVFDKLIEQGGCSVNADKNCVYRGLNGRKCAAGQLITDEEYKPQFEGYNCYGTDEELTLQKCKTATDTTKELMKLFTSKGINPKSLRVLQKAHDTSQSTDGEFEIALLKSKKLYLITKIEQGITLEDIEL